MSSVMRLHRVLVWPRNEDNAWDVALCVTAPCSWHGRFFDRQDAIRFAQRHRPLTAREEGQ